MTTQTAQEVISQIQAYGLENANDSLVYIPTLQVGEHIAQGDVYIWPLNDESLEGVELLPINEPSRQLAPGNTRGSRHCIRECDMPNLEFFQIDGQQSNELQGSVIFAKAPFILEHPEHGDQCYEEGRYIVTFQRSYSAEEIRRVAD